jgi:hypothetical protein
VKKEKGYSLLIVSPRGRYRALYRQTSHPTSLQFIPGKLKSFRDAQVKKLISIIPDMVPSTDWNVLTFGERTRSLSGWLFPSVASKQMVADAI